MTEPVDSKPRVGWEQIWRGKELPPRYDSFAAPDEAVVVWAKTLPHATAVLDIGCGIGRHCIYLGKRGFRVAGIDVSPTGVQITGALCAQHHLPFDGRVGDMRELPWPNMTFDGALSIATIHHQLRANIVQSLAEVWRVLQPGGLFVVDFPNTGTVAYQQVRAQVSAGQLVEPEPNTFVDERPNIPTSSDSFLPHHFCDEGDVRDLLSAFEIVRLSSVQPNPPDKAGNKGKWVAVARKPLPAGSRP